MRLHGGDAIAHVNQRLLFTWGNDLPHVDLRLHAGMLVFTWGGAVYMGKSGLHGEPAPPCK